MGRRLVRMGVGKVCGVAAEVLLILGLSESSFVLAAEADWVRVDPVERSQTCTIRIGVSSFAEHNPNHPIIEATLEHLSSVLTDEVVCVNFYHSTERLVRDLRRRETDFFISSSGLYRRTLALGTKDLGVVEGPHVGNPNRAEGSVFLTLASNTSVRTLEDARGRVFAANLDWGFSGYQTAVREVIPLGVRPRDFFRSTVFTGRDQAGVLKALLEGRAEVGAVKTCLLEAYEASHPAWRGKFRVLNEKHYPDFACRVSTRLYPNWVFAVTSREEPATARRVAEALLAMPPTYEGLSWGIGTDFSEVDGLMRDLRIGPYSVLDKWSLGMIWERYKVAITLFLTLLAGGAVHAWRTERLVRRRTRELTELHAKERGLLEARRRAEERLASMQKTAAIGQMSGMVAHELRQPLAAVEAYAHGLERLSETRMPEKDLLIGTLRKITREASRANGIVERVRRYARSKTARRTCVSPQRLFADAVRTCRLSERFADVLLRADLRLAEDAPVTLWADGLEVELALQNLLKNAAEAALRSERPEVDFTLSSEESSVVFTVGDNGPALSDEAFERLSVPLSSEKPEGLGLGLGIVRSIAEAHGGRLVIERREKNGVSARLILPIDLSRKEGE